MFPLARGAIADDDHRQGCRLSVRHRTRARSQGIRSFVGHVVSATTFGRLAPDPLSYELSFQCPRGLSGAPLLTRHDDSMLITGVVIGNQRTEMLVFSERESVSDMKEVITERFEALQLGIALQCRAFLDLGPFRS